MISLISQNLDVFSCAYTERPIVSYGLGWDSGVNFNFSKHRLTYSHIDTPLQVSTLESVSFYAKHCTITITRQTIPVGGAFVSFLCFCWLGYNDNIFVCSGVIFCY